MMTMFNRKRNIEMSEFKSLTLDTDDINYNLNDDELTDQSFWCDFERIRIVGKGSFGTAILCRHNSRLVIMKEIDLANLMPAQRSLALNESAILSRLSHPHVVTYYNTHRISSLFYIEMEYCEGGCLATFLSTLKSPLNEYESLVIFRQIVDGIQYVHTCNIVHRDLSTANIFITKERVFKVGDFGICKEVGTQGACTLVGTPHYFSPEMCQGKAYNMKTDIWALGCILYEMVCLRKTFQGSTLPAIVNKIVKGKYDPLQRTFSIGFQKLIRKMLNIDPIFRPYAHDILEQVDKLIAQSRYYMYNEMFSNELSTEFVMAAEHLRKAVYTDRSLLYQLHLYSPHISLTYSDIFNSNKKIIQISKSATHSLVLTQDNLIYAWGTHPSLSIHPTRPTIIQSLSDKTIINALAGDSFSVFLTSNGLVLTVGDPNNNILGHNSATLSLVSSLVGVNTSAIACGASHIIALTSEGCVYIWGDNSSGQCGGNEKYIISPTIVNYEGKEIYGGYNASVIVGKGVWIAGYGKNWRRLKVGDIKNVSLGKNFFALLEVNDDIVTMEGNYLRRLRLISKASRNSLLRVQCGDEFIIAQTVDSQLYFWGKRNIIAASSTKSSHDTQNIITIADHNNSLMSIISRDGPDYPVIVLRDPTLEWRFQPILAMYSSQVFLALGHSLSLSNFYVFGTQVYIVVDTTLESETRDKPRLSIVPETDEQENGIEETATSISTQLDGNKFYNTIPMMNRDKQIYFENRNKQAELNELTDLLEKAQNKINLYEAQIKDLRQQIIRMRKKRNILLGCMHAFT